MPAVLAAFFPAQWFLQQAGGQPGDDCGCERQDYFYVLCADVSDDYRIPEMRENLVAQLLFFVSADPDFLGDYFVHLYRL